MSRPSHRFATAPPAEIATDDDVEALRTWALAALADGRGPDAVDVVIDVPCDDEQLSSLLIDVETEIRVRVGIAEDDVGLVLGAIALGDFPSEPEPCALMARGIGADWLVRQSVASHGRAARFREGRSMIGMARQALQLSLSSGGLSAGQEAEATATLDALNREVWRPPFSHTPERLRRHETPSSLIEAHATITACRRPRLAPAERVMALCRSLAMIGRACEPKWPVHGGPWWVSESFGLTVDVAEPADERGRHRWALADCFLELEDLRSIRELIAAGPADDVPDLDRAFTVADAALWHAARSGLAA